MLFSLLETAVLGSVAQILLTVPNKTTAGGRAFSYIALKLWNYLPTSVRDSDTLSTLKTRLTTHLFAQAFCNLSAFISCLHYYSLISLHKQI